MSTEQDKHAARLYFLLKQHCGVDEQLPPEQITPGMLSTIRKVVSKKKLRFQKHGYDLDLSYISNRVIAMGLPSEGIEALYRNPMEDVLRFFSERHTNHYRVYNLCSEPFQYEPSNFESVAHFPFDDHCAPPLILIKQMCQSMDEFLNAHPNNLVAVHCKAGKGRTGTVLSAYLVHCGVCDNAREAIKLFGKLRTSNGNAVGIPSQIRYIEYYVECLKRGFPVIDAVLKVKKVNLSHYPTSCSQIQCKVYQLLGENTMSCVFQSGLVSLVDGLEIHGLESVMLHGDVRFDFSNEKDQELFSIWLNTNFITDNVIVFPKSQLDCAFKDKKCELFDAAFTVSVSVEHVRPGETSACVVSPAFFGKLEHHTINQ